MALNLCLIGVHPPQVKCLVLLARETIYSLSLHSKGWTCDFLLHMDKHASSDWHVFGIAIFYRLCKNNVFEKKMLSHKK